MSALSLLAIALAVVFYWAPPIELTETVQHPGLSLLWTNKLVRQMSGFFLLFLFATSIVFSARKRIKKFSFGDFEGWRVAHAALGAFCVFGAFLHTGFRKGEGLDHALLLVVLGSIFLGGVAGGYQLILGAVSPQRAQTLRAWLVRSHIYLLWPLPVLLLFHVVKVYFF
jgi:nitrite reductase (NADH) large subunit